MVSDHGITDSGYYENVRQEVAALVDNTRVCVLDVGCAKGALGEHLKRIVPGRKVFGVEYFKDVGQAARQKLDGVIIGDVQTIDLPFEPSTFDCIIFADVLEHLLDPASVLKKLRPLLKPDGVIICSIPNMRHYTVILRLLQRGWEYDNFGLFDRTHLRFFSLGSMKRLLADAGYSIESVTPRIAASKKMLLLNSVAAGKLEEFVASQYLLKARPVAAN